MNLESFNYEKSLKSVDWRGDEAKAFGTFQKIRRESNIRQNKKSNVGFVLKYVIIRFSKRA
jgi:hypothetical protein